MSFRLFRTASLALLVSLFLVSCSSNKTLDESSAKRLINADLDAKGYKVPLGAVAQLVKAGSREDILNGSYNDPDPKAQLQRLLKAGYITQTSGNANYLNVSGTYKADLTGCGLGIAVRSRVLTLTLSMPAGRTVSGDYAVERGNVVAPRLAALQGQVHGEVNSDGTLTLTGPRGRQASYKIDSNGGTITLTGPAFLECSAQLKFVGTGPGGSVTVASFGYAYADKMNPLVDAAGNFQIGKMKADQVQNLLLDGDTVATAQFNWHVDFNDAGAAFTGNKAITGQGSVKFRKQPDGSWVLPSS